MKRLSYRKRPARNNKPLPFEIKSITDLIRLAQTEEVYDNINTTMLWNILPQLIDIEELIGLSELKQSIFYQIIYYLQNLHNTSQDGEFLHTVITGSPGSGKCLAKGTRVFLYDGSLKNVENIVIGDVLIGDDFTPRIVFSICQGHEKMYKIVYGNTYEYIVNESHILTLLDNDHQVIDIPLLEYLNTGENYKGLRTSVEYENGEDFQTDPFVTGYIMLNIFDNNFIDITDASVARRFHNIFDNISSNTMILRCELELDFSKIYKKSQLRLFLEGVFHHSQTIHLSQEIHYNFIVNALNVVGADYTKNIRTSFVNNVRVNTFTISYISLPFNDERVLSTYNIDVYEMDNDDYYGFELSGNGRFILENGIITHNTTVARIIGEMYKNMGVLSQNGVFKIVKREDLVAEYLGQTAIKTKKLLDSCVGGVLFIDEVYSLGPGVADKDSFSKEAIDTLNLYLSEHKRDFCCIVAGYEDEIQKCFFSVNPGLERRFQWVHRINKYSSKELVEMFYKQVEIIGWKTNIVPSKLETIIEQNEKLFVYYGGDIENLVTKCKMTHAYNLINNATSEKTVIGQKDLNDAIDMIKTNRLQMTEMDPYHMYL